MDIGGERRRVTSYVSSNIHARDKTLVDNIMLRFRPIAPKPDSGGPVTSQVKNGLVSNVRVKRKYVRVKKSNEPYKRRREKLKSSSSNERKKETSDDQGNDDVLTLQFLPVKSAGDVSRRPSRDSDGSLCYYGGGDGAENNDLDRLKEKQPYINDLMRSSLSDRTAVVDHKKALVETWVTVESVTDTCMAGIGEYLGCTDVERMKSLEKDTCPGFISDGLNRVLWVNEAYMEMVDVKITEMSIRLEGAEKLLAGRFNDGVVMCWVRLRYTWQEEKKSVKTVPCDVWRMDFGGYAWRLDMKVALSLGFQNAN